jgi:hypothetical protein
MAYSSIPTRNCLTCTQRHLNPALTEPYDLDDPCLILKLQRQQPNNARSITCRFLAVPVNEPGVFFRDISQYGTIIHESRDKLIMRVPWKTSDLLHRIRHVWVSKYLAPFTECTMSLDLPRQDRDQNTTVIIQRVLHKCGKDRKDSLLSNASEGVPAKEFNGAVEGGSMIIAGDPPANTVSTITANNSPANVDSTTTANDPPTKDDGEAAPQDVLCPLDHNEEKMPHKYQRVGHLQRRRRVI